MDFIEGDADYYQATSLYQQLFIMPNVRHYIGPQHNWLILPVAEILQPIGS